MLGRRPVAYRPYVLAAVLWALLLVPLAFWGIPTAAHDGLLFGGPTWTADQFRTSQRLDDLRDGRGADVDRNPLLDRTRPAVLTATAADRAEILTRYRLYSQQPDEMITFRALQRMNPRGGDFDPKLYQYGGIYIYGVGATLVLGHVLGLLTVTGNLDHYLEHPSDFGHFYVAARLLSLVAGAVLLVCLARLAAGVAGRAAGWLTLLLVAACPVFLCGALEAKPHLPSAAAIAGAMLLLAGYLRRPTWGRAVAIGAVSGLAFGLVLTGLVAGALCASLALVRRPGRSRWPHAVVALLVFGLVYAAANPYLVYNQLFAPETVRSNLGNSTAMYALGWRGFVRVAELLWEGAGPLAVLGVIGWLLLAARHGRNALLLSSAAACLLLIGGLLGAGKPAEFARFLVLPACGLAMCGAILIASLTRGQALLTIVLAFGLLPFTGVGNYLWAFRADAVGEDWRLAAARYIESSVPEDAALGVVQEPAPFSIPPLDFTHRAVVLLPETPVAAEELPGWLVLTADGPEMLADAWWREHYELVFATNDARLTPITWANKAAYLLRKRGSEGARERGSEGMHPAR